MLNLVKTKVAFLVVAAVLTLPPAARSADAPNWVAALHIGAQNAVGLRWTPVAGATEYKILRSTTAGSGYAEIAATPQPQYFDKDVSPGDTYYYVLQSVAGGEVSVNSAEKSVSIPGEKKVKAVEPPTWKETNLNQSTEFGKTVSKVGLFWNRPEGNVIAYNLYRSETSGSGHIMLTSTSDLQYIDDKVEVGKTYYYVVTALDDSFQETGHSAEQPMEITAPQKVERKKRKEKLKIMLRKTVLFKSINTGSWGELKQPGSLAVADNGDIYIVDSLQNLVFVFDSAGEFLFTFGEPGREPGQIHSALDIAICPDDEIYIANSNPRIEVFDLDGSHKRTIELADVLPDGAKNIAAGIFCAADSWYLSGNKDHTVYNLSYDGNEVLGKVGGLGKEPGQLTSPGKVYFSPEHGLFVADTFNFRVQVFQDGEAKYAFGTYGNSVGQFARLLDVAEDDMGNVLAGDFMNNSVQAFTPEGDFRYVMAKESMDGQIGMSAPTKIVFKNKKLYAVNKLGAFVDIFNVTDEIDRPLKGKKQAN